MCFSFRFETTIQYNIGATPVYRVRPSYGFFLSCGASKP